VSKRAPPSLYFAASAVFHYLGPAFAVLLFARVDVLGVAWLRIAAAALVFAAWRRPWRAYAALGHDGRRLLLAWGTVLALMNACFYLAISRLPLGTVAAIEFVPVVVLAAVGARSARNLLALALAAAGVYLLTDVRLAGAPLGIALAFANALLFALYIVLADRVAKHPNVGRRCRRRARDRRCRRPPPAGGVLRRASRIAVIVRCGRGPGIRRLCTSVASRLRRVCLARCPARTPSLPRRRHHPAGVPRRARIRSGRPADRHRP
jgi:hypothetical protein